MIEFALPPISVLLVDFDEDLDWAIFTRTDGVEFSSFLELCEESNLPDPSAHTAAVKIIHFPVGLLNESDLSYLEAHNVDSRVQQYSNVEHTKLVVESGLFKGSSGAPYIDVRGKVVAMHLSSLSDQSSYDRRGKIRRVMADVADNTDALSDAMSNQSGSKYASLKQGLVLRKINAIIAHLI